MNLIEKAICNYNDSIARVFPDEGAVFSLKTVLFDMDGVLYDSMPNHAIAWEESMKKFGITMTKADAYATEGARGFETIQHFVKEQQGRDITREEAEAMYEEKARIFHTMPDAPIFDGVKALMEKITEAGLTINIVTGSAQRQLIDRLTHDFGEFLTTEHITTAFDVKHGKPAPDPYLTGLRKAGGRKPWEGIVIENAPLGVKAGASANIFTVAINSGPLPDSVLTEAGANILYQHITEFCDDWEQFIKA